MCMFPPSFVLSPCLSVVRYHLAWPHRPYQDPASRCLHLLVHHLSFPLRQSVSHPFCFLGVLYDSLYITPNALLACSLRQFVCHPLVLFTCLYYIMSAIPFCFLGVLYDSLYIIPNALFACSLRQSVSTCPIRFKFYMMHITFYCDVSFSSYFTLFHL